MLLPVCSLNTQMTMKTLSLVQVKSLKESMRKFSSVAKSGVEQRRANFLNIEFSSFVLKDVHKIQMDLSYGEGVFKGIRDALPEAKISTKGIYQDSGPPKLQIFLVSITSGEIKNERISLKTKLGECINLKLNCRENLVLSPSPIKLEIRDVKGDCDVGDVALIKMEGLELRNPTYHAVCEDLIFSKCICSL